MQSMEFGYRGKLVIDNCDGSRVPVRIAIGPKDLQNKTIQLYHLILPHHD